MARHCAPSFAALSLVLAIAAPSFGGQDPSGNQQPGPGVAALKQRAEREGRVRVLVEFRLPAGDHTPEGQLPDTAAVDAQRRAIADAGAQVIGRLDAASHRLVRRYRTIPYAAVDVSASALDALASSPGVRRIVEDSLVHPILATSVPLVEGDQVWASGYDGAGTTVAVLDSGVDSAHPFLTGKVVEEACYSSTVPGTSRSVCPNGQDEQIGAGAAAPCALSSCNHGTHVAGIAAGSGATAGQSFSGVAKNARIMAVQVFSEITDAIACGGIAPCMGGYASDVIAGLERVHSLASQHRIAAVNMSLGSGAFSAHCDGEPYKSIIDNLRSIGVATIVATGNSGRRTSISSPACISSAVSVASTDRNDQVSWFSNMASFVSLLAPGEGIVSSIPSAGYASFSGTSMAAPHVAGAWAVLRQAAPTASVAALLNALQETGVPVPDTRLLGTVTVPRLRMLRALATFVPINNPMPVVTSVSPARVRAGTGPATVTVNGGGFNSFSVMHWNGAPRATTVIGTTQLRGTLTAADVGSAGSGQVSVVSPPPGGGTSLPLTLAIDPPPALTVDATTVGPGSSVTVTLSHGFGGGGDWLALAATGAANSSYLKWTYVGGGITDRTWTVAMPSTAGTYEFRLFTDNSYTRAATSPTVTVDPSFNPIPVATALSPLRAVAGGSGFVLTVNGSGFISGSTVRWNGTNRMTALVSSTQVQASITAADVAAVGPAQVTVFTPSPGGGTSAPLTFTVSPPPSIAVSATSVPTGAAVTATLTGGLGGVADWLALASTSAPNFSYLKYVYVGAGTFDRTWTVAMPLTPGTYEFRLFVGGGYTRAATSPTVTVVQGPNPVPVLTSTTPASMIVGGGAFTLTVRGSGFAPASVVRWNGVDRSTSFVNSTELRATVLASDVASAGAAQVTVFSPAPGGGLSAPAMFTIGASTATLAVSTTTATAGGAVTVTLSGGYGGTGDWLALASTSSPNSSYVQYVYVGPGVTTRTWTVNMPSTAGTYEFRLFTNGYTRLATSPTILVSTNASPPLP